METKLGCILPTYDLLDRLKVLIKQIFDYTSGDFIVYVVENGQKEETVEWLKTQNVKLILNEVNKGTSASWNMGMVQALEDGCTHFAILSDDTELPPKWWDICKKQFENGSHLVSINDGLKHIIFSGWFLVVDKRFLEVVGFFDEQFFFYFEDLDLSQRLSQSGLKYSIIKLNVIHHDSATIVGNFKKKKNKFFMTVYRDSRRKFRAKYPHLKFRM